MSDAAMTSTIQPPVTTDDITDFLQGYELSLRARNRSPKTITGYLQTVLLFADFLSQTGLPRTVNLLARGHVEAFVADQVARWKPKTAQIRYGDLRQFFNWLVTEGEISAHPMAAMKPPTVPEQPVPVVPDDDLKLLLKACGGSGFDERRDTAIVRVLFDCGIRLGELTKLKIDDVDFDQRVLHVLGKGRRERAVPFGKNTGQALDRYLRTRRKHPLASVPSLWLGTRGPLTDSGVTQMLRRRCVDAGIGRLHPHQLRHTSAHAFFALGGREGDAMRLFGWRSAQMTKRYGASAADQRARDAYWDISPGDRL